MFSEDIEHTDNNVLTVSYRDRPTSRNIHADITPVLCTPWPIFLKPIIFKENSAFELNQRTCNSN